MDRSISNETTSVSLFTDGSVDPQSKVGYGAYFSIPDHQLTLENAVAAVKVKRFTNTSSSKLELQCLLWALSQLPQFSSITIYTDSQNIIGLPGRRERLESNDFRNSKHERLRNYELYKEFYGMTNEAHFRFIKVKGHRKSNQKDHIDKLFTLVDQAAREALRNDEGNNG
jgi:ribonuclease HI